MYKSVSLIYDVIKDKFIRYGKTLNLQLFSEFTILTAALQVQTLRLKEILEDNANLEVHYIVRFKSGIPEGRKKPK